MARIKLGFASELTLGNLDAARDWGHARDYVHAMWLMLQQEVPSDYVVATGRTTTVREFCRIAFECAGLDYKHHVRVSQSLLAAGGWKWDVLQGDAGRARQILGWIPETNLEDLAAEMVEADLVRHRHHQRS